MQGEEKRQQEEEGQVTKTHRNHLSPTVCGKNAKIECGGEA